MAYSVETISLKLVHNKLDHYSHTADDKTEDGEEVPKAH